MCKNNVLIHLSQDEKQLLEEWCACTCAYLLDDPRRPPNTEGVRLRFGSTHTRIRCLQIRDLTWTSDDLPSRGNAQRHTITWRWPAGTMPKLQEMPTKLEIFFEGEPPYVIDHSWLPTRDARIVEIAAPAFYDLDAIYDRRKNWIEAFSCTADAGGRHPANMPLRDRMMFFYRFDVQTLPGTRECQIGDEVVIFRDLLWERLKARNYETFAGRPFNAPRLSAAQWQAARAVSSKIVEICEEELGADPRFHKFDDCFESFVSGDLAIGANSAVEQNQEIHAHGAPNSAAYFLLAEAALCLIDEERNPDHIDRNEARARFWEQALSTFVRTSDIFAKVFWNGGCRKPENYSWQWGSSSEIPREHTAFAYESRKRLRNAYRGLGSRRLLEAKFCTILNYALSDQAILR